MSQALVDSVSGESALLGLQMACLLALPLGVGWGENSVVSLLIRALISFTRAPLS